MGSVRENPTSYELCPGYSVHAQTSCSLAPPHNRPGSKAISNTALHNINVHVCTYTINKARQIHTPRTAFKERTAVDGIQTHDTPRSR